MAEQKQEEQPLKQMFLDAGYPEGEMHHHFTDLYVFVTPVTTKVIDQWCSEHGYTKDWHISKFKDQVTGRPMYDCAFQWYEEVKENAKAI